MTGLPTTFVILGQNLAKLLLKSLLKASWDTAFLCVPAGAPVNLMAASCESSISIEAGTVGSLQVLIPSILASSMICIVLAQCQIVCAHETQSLIDSRPVCFSMTFLTYPWP